MCCCLSNEWNAYDDDNSCLDERSGVKHAAATSPVLRNQFDRLVRTANQHVGAPACCPSHPPDRARRFAVLSSARPGEASTAGAEDAAVPRWRSRQRENGRVAGESLVL